MNLIIELESPKTIVVKEAVTKTVESIVLLQFLDVGTSVEAKLSIDNEIKDIILWDGDDYINIGQYTDTDIVNRIKELLVLYV